MTAPRAVGVRLPYDAVPPTVREWVEQAVGAALNPDTPGLFRREVGVLEHLGAHELWARLLASYDDGDWVALLIEDVEGRHPDFADAAELQAVLDGTDRSRRRPARTRGPAVGRSARRR